MSISPRIAAARRATGAPRPPVKIHKFWLKLDVFGWSNGEFVPVRASFPEHRFDVFAWLAEHSMRPWTEVHDGDAIGFFFSNPSEAVAFKLRWSEKIASAENGE